MCGHSLQTVCGVQEKCYEWRSKAVYLMFRNVCTRVQVMSGVANRVFWLMNWPTKSVNISVKITILWVLKCYISFPKFQLFYKVVTMKHQFCAQKVLKMFTEVDQTTRLSFLETYYKDGDSLLDSIVAIDESYIICTLIVE